LGSGVVSVINRRNRVDGNEAKQEGIQENGLTFSYGFTMMAQNGLKGSGMSVGDFLESLPDRAYFFDEGLRFACTQCGTCCTGEPGIVYVEADEACRIASFLEIPFEVLVERMLEPFKDGYTVREAEQGRCVFYENGCVVYPVRPVQCVTFPFWFQNTRSASAWDEVRVRCPGVGKGRLFTREEIITFVQASYPVYLKVVEFIYQGGGG
jgi:hypothetical protein